MNEDPMKDAKETVSEMFNIIVGVGWYLCRWMLALAVIGGLFVGAVALVKQIWMMV